MGRRFRSPWYSRYNNKLIYIIPLTLLALLFVYLYISFDAMDSIDCGLACDSSTNGYVLDIGFNQGGDSDLYLSMGYNVIAIEANPALIKRAKGLRRLSHALESKRLQLIHAAVVGVNYTGTTIQLYVNHKSDEFSSTIKGAGCRENTKCTPVDVPVTTCAQYILERNEAPHMMKIDIEGGDMACLQSVKDKVPAKLLPKYISIEAHTPTYIHMLEAMGYGQFKIVVQNFFDGNSGPFGDVAMNTLCSSRTHGWTHRWCKGSAPVLKHWIQGGFNSKKAITGCPFNILTKWELGHQACWFDIHAKLGSQ